VNQLGFYAAESPGHRSPFRSRSYNSVELSSGSFWASFSQTL
jgi:hypothetical protein